MLFTPLLAEEGLDAIATSNRGRGGDAVACYTYRTL